MSIPSMGRIIRGRIVLALVMVASLALVVAPVAAESKGATAGSKAMEGSKAKGKGTAAARSAQSLGQGADTKASTASRSKEKSETTSADATKDAAETPVKRARPASPGGAKPNRAQVQSMITQVSKQYGVERALVQAVVTAESNYNAHAVSPAGAVGLMQVMPATAGDYGVNSTHALFDPMTNLKTGTRHLKRLLKKYDNDYGRVIMAYNAGEGVVDRTNSNVTFRETLDYTEAVIRNYRRGGGSQATAGALTKVQSLRSIRHSNPKKARRLLKKYLDPSLLSLRVKPTLSLRSLNPALHAVGPESRPMFELDAEAIR